MVSITEISNDDGDHISLPPAPKKKKISLPPSPVDNISLPPSPVPTIDNNSLEHILVRLPLKHIVQMGTVSKHFLSVISTPTFVRHYCDHHKIPVLGLFWNKDNPLISNTKYNFVPLYWKISRSVPFETVNFAEEPNGLVILASCNGLLLCRTCDSGDDVSRYYIFNPFTAKYKALPSSPLKKSRSSTVFSVGLAFEPLNSPYYKVVFVWSDKATSQFSVEMFSSQNSTWLSCEDGCLFSSDYRKCGVCWKGVINWISNVGSLLCFDVEKKVTSEIARNQNDLTQWFKEKKVDCFGVFEDVLRFVEVYRDQSSFDVYDMKDDYSGFRKVCIVELDFLEEYFPRLQNGCFSILYLDKSVGVILFEGEIIVVDLKDQTGNTIYDTQQANNHNSDSFSVFPYVASLAQV